VPELKQTATPSVEISHVSKTYGKRKVVNDVCLSIRPGEIFGLIGPNGAGKTTTIRMMMDIIKPDSGAIEILGEALKGEAKDHIGYLPEERGLYKKTTVLDILIYLAQLKGIEPQKSLSRAEKLLERVAMLPHKDKKVEELSKGMSQLIQFLATIIHDPELIILDEPFAGLDPVNTELLKEIIQELKEKGKAIILSTHQMSQVEELCDRIMMINKGKNVLYGNLTDIQKKFSNNSVLVEYSGELGELDGVTGSQQHDKYLELFLGDGTSPDDVLKQLVSQGVRVNRFEVATPALNEIFIQVAGEKGG
jgi:ABC-2 type transport system ATP-binding protein